ncbi:MAG: low molecular weight protein arginine phosphatase [Candidatus Brockarchaeota archaeon]|nr:low molecular weight protein arginine phosphatase [Candidatus Brockarchaeota archaeon]
MRILFVCEGNIFRSTMAEALFNRIIEDAGYNSKDMHASSAGIIAVDGSPASPYAVFAMKKRRICLESFRARRLTPELVQRADLILTMEEKHRRYVLELAPEAWGKTYTLKAFCGREGEIYDLGGGGFDEAEKIAQEIEDCIRASLPRIIEMAGEAEGHRPNIKK